MKIVDFLDDHEWVLMLFCIFIVLFTLFKVIDLKLLELYEVQSQIVIHDYGHVFEDINDWKLEKIERFEKGAFSDV